MTIIPARHPLLQHMREGAQWVGRDAYPAFSQVADEHERWLEFVNGRGELGRYLPRLRGPAVQRDVALGEIGVAYFLERYCGLPIRDWEPKLPNGKAGDFLVRLPDDRDMFVEVKSPSWLTEVGRAEGSGSPRLTQPKYIEAQGGATAPWVGVRDAVRRAYAQTPGNIPTLLVIADDLFVPLSSAQFQVDIALYCSRGRGKHPPTSYLSEDGYFVASTYERLGAVGTLNMMFSRFTRLEYRFTLYDNPRCLEAVAVPRTIFLGYQRTDGTAEAG